MRGLLIIILSFTLAYGVIDENLVDPELIEEKIETNCPADPTFGGQCQLISSSVPEPSGCREIDKVRVCRDWWKREFTYRCDGNISIDHLLSTFEGLEYCTYEKRCVRWKTLAKRGGVVSCRIYYDKNKPGCDSNPYQPQCIANDCGELFDKCKLLNYTSYSDIKDKANLETTYYCDPVSGMCGYQDVPSTSGVRVGVYTFKCPSDIRKVCVSEEIVKKCPDGTESVCSTVRVCKEWETSSSTGKTVKSCIAKRKFRDYEAIKGSSEADSYRNNPLCVKLGENLYTVQAKAVFSWGWDGDGGDDCSSCESYVTGLQIKELDGMTLEGSRACYKVSDASGRFPSKRQLVSYLNRYLRARLPNAAVMDADLGSKRRIRNNPYNRTCFGDNDPPGNNKGYEVPITLAITYESFRCFENSLDTSGCDGLSGCTPISPIPNLEELECHKFAMDSENTLKLVCSEYSINYECEEPLNLTNCKEWETRTSCASDDIVIPQLSLEGLDFSNDFKKAIAFAQAVNELKHVWTGEPKVCENGWWNSIVQNPGDYFVSKAVSYAVARFGSEIASAATEYFRAASFCLNPAYATVGASGVADCMTTVAESSYGEGGGTRNAFLEKVCNGASSFCGAAEFLSNPVVTFAISVAWDLISSTEKCSTCSSERCAARHNDYKEYVLVSKGLCHYVGSKCSWKIWKWCLRRAYKYCCYDSKFARILVEQAYRQLGRRWGDYDSPNCSALTFDDLKKLDFSRMDFSELIAEIEAKMQMKVDKDYIKQAIENFFGGGIQPTGETPWGAGP